MMRTIVLGGLLSALTVPAASWMQVVTADAGLPIPVAQRGVVKPGEAAPNFQLRDLNGQLVSLSDLRGKVVLLNFWATWCDPCKDEMPRIVAAFHHYREAGLQVLAVNLTDQESLGDVRKFVDVYHVPFPVALDRKGKVRRRYALRGVPTSVFIDGQGLVRAVHTGPVTADTLEVRVAEILTPP